MALADRLVSFTVLNYPEVSAVYKPVSGCPLALVALFHMSSCSRTQAEGAASFDTCHSQGRGKGTRDWVAPQHCLESFCWTEDCVLPVAKACHVVKRQRGKDVHSRNPAYQESMQVAWQLLEMYQSFPGSKWLSIQGLTGKSPAIGNTVKMVCVTSM